MKTSDKPRLDSKSPPRPDDIDVIPQPTHPSKFSKVMTYAVIVALVVVAFGLLRIFTWAFDNGPVLVVKNSPFPTRTIRDHPTGGGVVFLDADYCKYKNVEGDLRLSFLGKDREVFLPITKERGPVTCQRVEVPVIIPADITPGEYKVKFRVTYDKNPLKQNEVVEFESRVFTIDPTTP